MRAWRGGKYECYRCRRVTALSTVEFNAIRVLSMDDLEHLGLLARFSKSLTLGHALPIEHAKDLYRAGLTAAELNGLARG